MSITKSSSSVDKITPSYSDTSSEEPQNKDSKANTSTPPVMVPKKENQIAKSKRAAYKELQTSSKTKPTRDLPRVTGNKTSNRNSVSGSTSTTNNATNNATTTSPVRSRSSSASGSAADQMGRLTSTAPILHSTSSTSTATTATSTPVMNPEWEHFHQQALLTDGYFKMDEEMNFNAVCSWLASSPVGIHSASFNFVPMSPANVLTLGEAIKGNDHLTELAIYQSEMGDEGAQALAKGLQGNTRLTSLNLAVNGIGDLGVQALAEVLKGNAGLTTVNLAGNNIGDEGAKELAEVLKGNSKLTMLYLGLNVISDSGAKSLATALETNHTLTVLDLVHNNIGSDLDKTLLANLDVKTAIDFTQKPYDFPNVTIRRKLRSNLNISALAQMAEANPPVALIGSEVPAEVTALIEQATIVADQKTGASRTQKETQASLNEIRLALALRSVTDER